MKNFIYGMLATAALGAVIVGTASQAGIYNWATTNGWPTVSTEHFLVEAKGYDMRGYIFTPQGMSDVTCIFVVGNTPSGLSCLRNNGK